MSWGLKEWTRTPRELCLEIILSCGVSVDPYFISMFWDECENSGYILQKDASRTFFNEFDLISHRVYSFDLSFDRLPFLIWMWKQWKDSAKGCIMNLLQWVWFDKSSGKLIWSFIRSFGPFGCWVELWSIKQEQGGMPPLYIEKSG